MLAQVKDSRGWFYKVLGASFPEIGRHVLFPFFLSRTVLLLIGWFSRYFIAEGKFFPIERGWLSPHRILDIWGRWDTGWYMSIVVDGYSIRGDLTQVQSNVAFFPLYPYLVRLGLLLIPDQLQTPGVILLIGVLISNACFLAALYVLYRLILHKGYSEAVASRAVLYLAIFPVSFIFSSFYTESLFLLLAVASVYLAEKGHWPTACLIAALAALTRSVGILIPALLVWIYMERIDWKWHRVRWDFVWLFIIFAAFGAFAFYLYQLTGDPLTFMHSHAAWQRQAADPWKTLISVDPGAPFITPLNRWTGIGFICLTFMALYTPRLRGYGLFALLNLCLILFSGNLISVMRICMVIFPAFIPLAEWGNFEVVDKVIVVLFSTLLGVLMALWSQGYWVV